MRMTAAMPIEGQAQAMRRVESLGRLLDDAWQIPGTRWRVGLDGLLGLVPVAGDAVTLALSAWLMVQARRAGASRLLLARMAANVALDTTVGAIPLLGDWFDFAFKANRRNVRLLQKHLAGRARGRAPRAGGIFP